MEKKRINTGLLRNDRMGRLPAVAPLAVPYVPYQGANPTQYPTGQGFVRGTMFPGLDLPFRGMVNNKQKRDTPHNEQMALSFAVTELSEYLDTHPGDQEAAELLRAYAERYHAQKENYEKHCGPLAQMDAAKKGGYAWIEGPWPWEYRDNEEG